MPKYSYTLIYVILTALSMVFINHAANFISPALNLFIGTWVAIVCFHVININYLHFMYAKAWQNKMLWLKIMLAVVGMWVPTIYGPALLTPNLFILLVSSITSLLGLAASLRSGVSIGLLISAMGIFINTLIIVVYTISQMPLTYQMLIGLCLTFIAGVSFFAYSKASYSFAKKTNMTVTQVLAVRFWLMEIACVVLLPSSPWQQITLYGISLVMIIAFISLIIPIYFLMHGIFKIGPDKNAILCGLIPTVTYGIESLYFQQFNMIILLLNIFVGLFIALPYIHHVMKTSAQ